MKTFISIIFFFLAFYIPLSAQQVLTKTAKNFPKISFSVGKSSENTLTKGKDAEVIGTFPSSDTVKNSWLTNAYAEIKMKSDLNRWSIGLLTELHKNTLIEKKQNVFQNGISFEKVFSTRDSIGLATTEFPLSITVKNSNDKIKKNDVIQIIGGISFNRLTGPSILKTKTFFPQYGSFISKVICFSHNHNLGFAYLGYDENVLLGQLDFEFNTYLLPVLSYKWTNKLDLFKFQFAYKGRTQLLGKTDLDLKSLITFQVGINIAFDKKNSIGISYDWVRGSDPLIGLQNQSYQALTAKIKFTIN
jgi:hypothetical protein